MGVNPQQLNSVEGVTDNIKTPTQGYVDDAIADALGGVNFDYFFTDTAEGVIADTDLMIPQDTGSPESTAVKTITAADTTIQDFITELAEPQFLTLVKGVYEVHVHAEKTAGTQTASLYAVLYKRASGGAVTLLGTTESVTVTAVKIEYDLHFSLPEDEELLADDRLGVIFVGTPGGTGTDPEITLYLEGDNASRVSVRTTSSALDDRYLVKGGLPGGQTITDDITIVGELEANQVVVGNATLTSSSLSFATGGGNAGIESDDLLYLNAGTTFSVNTNGLQSYALSDANPGSVTTVAKFRHFATGTVVDGVGTAIEFNTNNDNVQQVKPLVIEAIMDDVSDGEEDSSVNFKILNGGSAVTPLSLGALTQITTATGIVLSSPGNLMVSSAANSMIRDDTTLDALVNVAKFSHTVTGTPADGIGASIILNAPNEASTQKNILQIEASMTDAANGSEDTLQEFKGIKAGVEVSSLALIGQDAIMGRGDIEGFVPIYNSTTAVDITLGKIEANGKYFVLESNATHAMTSLATAYDHHYIYIDDSASTSGGVPVIIDATTEPAWSDSKRGFYNGDDRMICAVTSEAGAAEVAYFTAIDLGGRTVQNIVETSDQAIASSMDPSGAWQVPDVSESSVVLPIGAINVLLKIANTDTGTSVRLYATAKESADAGTATDISELRVTCFGTAAFTFWVTLGASRNIRITGTNTNDNNLGCAAVGYKYKR